MKHIEITKDQLINELRQSEENYRNIVESSPDGILTIDTKGFITSFNTAYSKLTGFSKEEYIGKHFSKLPTLDKRDIPKILKLFASVIVGKQIESPLEFTWIHKDGTRRLGEYYYSVLRSHGKIKGFQIVARDITERKHTEEALRESEERYRAVIQDAHDMIQSVRPDSSFVFVNPAWLQTLGYTEEDLPGLHLFDVIHPESLAHCQELFAKVIGGEYVKDISATFIAKSGRRVMVEGNAAPRFIGSDIVSTQGIFRDVTERKQAEEELRDSGERYHTLFDNSNDAVFVHHPTPKGMPGIFIEVNKAACRLLGYTKKELLQLSGLDIGYFVEGQRTPAEFIKELLAHKHTVGEVALRTKQGKHVPIEMSARLFKLHGKPTVLTIARDITERKKAEEERTKAARLESVGTLAGGIAHDFNNLLTGITGFIGLAKRSVELGETEKAASRLAEAEKASLRARDLTTQLLTFARGGAPVKQVTSTADLLRDTIAFTLRGSNVRCNVSLPGDLWSVEVDEAQVGQAISNIVLNADEAMPDGGVCIVKAQNTVISEKSTLPLSSGKYVKVTIKDQGVGISKEHLDKIFDPYFTTKQKGSGLGLATAYSIVNNHNGYITAKSQLGVGTTFYLYLPASEKLLPVKKEEVVKTPLTGRGRILVMDDEDVIRQLLLQELTEVGYEVELSRDGAEAIELYKQAKKQERPFDAVILDLTIPGGMGGMEAIRELLKIDSEVKAIVSSGYATDPIMADYKRYGLKGVIAKPYNITQLEEKLHTLLRKTK